MLSSRRCIVKYQNKDTGEILSIDDIYLLYRWYIDNNIIDDYGFDDFLDGATDINGLFEAAPDLNASDNEILL